MRDAFGLLPPQVRAGIERDEMVEAHHYAAKALDAALKDHDRHLACVWVRGDISPVLASDLGVTPGRWHVRRQNPTTRDTYIVIETPEGSYREPDSGVLEQIRRMDLQRRGALDKLLVKDPPAAFREAPDTLADEQRRDELRADIRTAKRVAGDGGLRKRAWAKK